MEADLVAGRRPLFVCATAGATNTGVIDPLPEVAAICREREVWFHVDAAYGGFAALTDRGRAQLQGIELADSVTLDPHKWLYQPYECGSLLVRQGRLLRRAFEITPDYLRDAQVHGQEVNFADMGVQLTRSTRALKLWMSLKLFGVDAFRRTIDRAMDLTVAAQKRIEGTSSLELLSPATLSIVCFRRRFGGVSDEATLDHMNAELVHGLEESGVGLITSTRLRGRYAMRMCVLNHTTGPADVERVLDWLERGDVAVPAVPEPEPAYRARGYDRDPDIDRGWVRRSRLTAQSLAEVPLFQALSPEQLERAGGSAREVDVRAGETVVRKWEYSRDFYLILSGTAEVWDEGKHLRDLGPGDFFGELAALEWGAGYSYPRLATVTAATDLRLLVLPAEELNHLVRESPEIEEAVRRAARERLNR